MTSHPPVSGTGPITPAQLLIALHHIEGKGEDMKGVIAATNLCFAEKGIYTSEVLAIVLTQLLEVLGGHYIVTSLFYILLFD